MILECWRSGYMQTCDGPVSDDQTEHKKEENRACETLLNNKLTA